MDQVKFVEDSLEAAEGRPYHFKFFKDCLPQILFGPFLNTLSHMKQSFLNYTDSLPKNVLWTTSFSHQLSKQV